MSKLSPPAYGTSQDGGLSPGGGGGGGGGYRPPRAPHPSVVLSEGLDREELIGSLKRSRDRVRHCRDMGA